MDDLNTLRIAIFEYVAIERNGDKITDSFFDRKCA